MGDSYLENQTTPLLEHWLYYIQKGSWDQEQSLEKTTIFSTMSQIMMNKELCQLAPRKIQASSLFWHMLAAIVLCTGRTLPKRVIN